MTDGDRMFQVLCESLTMQKAIFGAVLCGDFLLALLILLLAEMRKERREARENREIRKVLTGFPPDAPPEIETDEARRVREGKEDAEAWRQVMSYSAADAYGGGEGG